MGKSTVYVVDTVLEEFIKNARTCGFEYLGKVGYCKKTKTYTVAIRGPNVPDVPLVVAAFNKRFGNYGDVLSVDFVPAS
jgi:hypothetical protein